MKSDPNVTYYYSEILEERYIIQKDGSVAFEGWVIYTKDEMKRIKRLTDDEKRLVHVVKKNAPGSKVIR